MEMDSSRFALRISEMVLAFAMAIASPGPSVAADIRPLLPPYLGALVELKTVFASFETLWVEGAFDAQDDPAYVYLYDDGYGYDIDGDGNAVPSASTTRSELEPSYVYLYEELPGRVLDPGPTPSTDAAAAGEPRDMSCTKTAGVSAWEAYDRIVPNDPYGYALSGLEDEDLANGYPPATASEPIHVGPNSAYGSFVWSMADEPQYDDGPWSSPPTCLDRSHICEYFGGRYNNGAELDAASESSDSSEDSLSRGTATPVTSGVTWGLFISLAADSLDRLGGAISGLSRQIERLK